MLGPLSGAGLKEDEISNGRVTRKSSIGSAQLKDEEVYEQEEEHDEDEDQSEFVPESSPPPTRKTRSSRDRNKHSDSDEKGGEDDEDWSKDPHDAREGDEDEDGDMGPRASRKKRKLDNGMKPLYGAPPGQNGDDTEDAGRAYSFRTRKMQSHAASETPAPSRSRPNRSSTSQSKKSAESPGKVMSGGRRARVMASAMNNVNSRSHHRPSKSTDRAYRHSTRGSLDYLERPQTRSKNQSVSYKEIFSEGEGEDEDFGRFLSEEEEELRRKREARKRGKSTGGEDGSNIRRSSRRSSISSHSHSSSSKHSSASAAYDAYSGRRTRSSGVAFEIVDLPPELEGRRSNSSRKKETGENTSSRSSRSRGETKDADEEDDEETQPQRKPRLRLKVNSPPEDEDGQSPPTNKRKRDGSDDGDGSPHKDHGSSEHDDESDDKKDDEEEEYKDDGEDDDDDDDEMSVAEEEEPVSPQPEDDDDDDQDEELDIEDDEDDDDDGIGRRRLRRLSRKRDAPSNGLRRNLRPRNRNGSIIAPSKSRKASTSRSMRAFVVDDDDDSSEEKGKPKGLGVNDLSASNVGAGIPPRGPLRRRLRPRNQKVDYARQLHPGKGWVGQPLEALGLSTDVDNPRRPNRASFKRRDRRDRVGEENGNYRPGRFSNKGRFFGSDDDDSVQGTPKRRTGGPSSTRTNIIEPINIAEIIRAQESAILKDLPEEEREEFEKDSRMFRTSSKDLADTDPVGVSKVSFESIGGLEDHIRSLKEMVVMPLLYPEIFSGFQINAPRGVLFYGPPGTGKTLMARALAASCSTSTQKVAFFMRKGADVLSKWVGESERQLRLLFEQAKTFQPSIIFFDEIDGLAPVRSSKQDQIHASIVSTLLALMDGLDSRGQVVVIGATNRIDAIDPALRRPGRFDRELFFPLPAEDARLKIIETTTKKWNPPLEGGLLRELARSTRGYCGADVKALCTEAALCAVRRNYPEIYESGQKLQICMESINVLKEDFVKSMKSIIPSTQRSSNVYSNPIPAHIYPLVSRGFNQILASLDVLAPLLTKMSETRVEEFSSTDLGEQPLSSSASYIPTLGSKRSSGYVKSLEPRLVISGATGMGQKLLGPAALERLEAQKFYIQSLDLASLLSDSTRSPEAAIIQLLHELKRHRPAVVYIPEVDVWWETLHDSAKTTLVSVLERDPMDPVLLLATCERPFRELPEGLRRLVNGRLGNLGGVEGWKRVIEMNKPDEAARKAFFKDLVDHIRSPPDGQNASDAQSCPPPRREPLPLAPEPPPRELTEAEIEALCEHDENLHRQLRMELRFIVNDIKRLKRFSEFHRPVDPDVYPDYYLTVKTPMDLETLLYNVNADKYRAVDEFVNDFYCILLSAESYNQPGSAIVQKAMDLFDVFMTYINTLKKREPEFVFELKRSAIRRRRIDLQRRKDGLQPIFSDDEPDTAPSSPPPAAQKEGDVEAVQPNEEDAVVEPKEAEASDFATGEKGEGDMEKGAGEGDVEMVEVEAAAVVNGVGEVVVSIEEIGAGGEKVAEVLAVQVLQDACVDGGKLEEIASEENAKEAFPDAKDSTPMDEDAHNIGMLVVQALKTTRSAASLTDQVASKLPTPTELATPILSPAMPADTELPPPTTPPPPARTIELDETQLFDFEARLIHTTQGRSVAEMEALGVALSACLERMDGEWNRNLILSELDAVLGRAVDAWQESPFV
ncbi:ATPase AAA domain-containing protein 2 [Dinochytrium kinnereticum]|nr:ATPase AAA domain-containing protein 2 [Dinochytrium kinnereticum]